MEKDERTQSYDEGRERVRQALEREIQRIIREASAEIRLRNPWTTITDQLHQEQENAFYRGQIRACYRLASQMSSVCEIYLGDDGGPPSSS